MTDTSTTLHGELEHWPTKEAMARLLRRAGLDVTVGRYSVRVNGCSDFSFEDYGGDLGDPRINADAHSPEAMLQAGRLVSNALTGGGIKHRFEIYSSDGEMIAYLHHEWPLE